jgi:thiamine-phosphate pyrophosphorylase
VNRFDPTLYVLTDRSLSLGRSHAEVVRRAIAGGATMIQYREKGASPGSMTAEAAPLAGLCREAGVPFLVNDRLEVARDTGADGLHLGQSDLDPETVRRVMGDGFLIGVSVRDAEEAGIAEAKGADYLAANGVFPTSSKTDLGEPLGLDGLKRIAGATRLPVVAIGGITPRNAGDAIRAGAAGVAVISCVVSATDIEAACADLLAAIAAGRR